ncbi:hypothetical protein ANO11243_059410 [Dothideomycetidae sp. 11243]|nr:hypothetical protein ANO11243_059410 [fungal sp. No.11243]
MPGFLGLPRVLGLTSVVCLLSAARAEPPFRIAASPHRLASPPPDSTHTHFGGRTSHGAEGPATVLSHSGRIPGTSLRSWHNHLHNTAGWDLSPPRAPSFRTSLVRDRSPATFQRLRHELGLARSFRHRHSGERHYRLWQEVVHCVCLTNKRCALATNYPFSDSGLVRAREATTVHNVRQRGLVTAMLAD